MESQEEMETHKDETMPKLTLKKLSSDDDKTLHIIVKTNGRLDSLGSLRKISTSFFTGEVNSQELDQLRRQDGVLDVEIDVTVHFVNGGF